jgi:hypothetical protein
VRITPACCHFATRQKPNRLRPCLSDQRGKRKKLSNPIVARLNHERRKTHTLQSCLGPRHNVIDMARWFRR